MTNTTPYSAMGAAVALLAATCATQSDAGGYVAPVVEYVITAPEVAATARTLTICQNSAEACALILAGLLAAAAAEGGGGGASAVDPDPDPDPDPIPPSAVPLPAGAVLLGSVIAAGGVAAVRKRRRS